jgi:hypothetical protein
MKRYSTLLIVSLFVAVGFSTLPASARTRQTYSPVAYHLVADFPLILGVAY